MHIEIDEIAKNFGTTAALHPVSLSLPSGALVALLGPSGSGKTTLLRILGGLEYPSSGRVLFNGQDATGMSVQERRAGFVFQHHRNVVAHRECQLARFANQFGVRLAVLEVGFTDWTNEDIKQAGIH